MNEYFMPKKLILYVPGFPGEAIPRKIGETRILDIVSAIVALKNINFEVISYTGIRDGRVFTFENTKIHVFNVIKNKINQGYSITLVGQSWGGLLSLLALDQFKLDQLLLITPFLLKLSANEINSTLKIYSKDFPRLIPTDSIEKNSLDIQSILSSFIKILQKDDNQIDIKVLANTQDEIISIDILKELFLTSNFFASNVTLTTSINDHNFSHGTDELIKWLECNIKKN